jgi:hypothetical protein
MRCAFDKNVETINDLHVPIDEYVYLFADNSLCKGYYCVNDDFSIDRSTDSWAYRAARLSLANETCQWHI